MLGLQQLVGSVKEVRAVAKGIENEMNEQLLTGLTGSARTVVSAALFRETGRSQLVVTHNLYQAQKIYEDLVELLDEDTVYLYPVNELISAEIAVASPEMKAQRLDLLNALVQDFKGIVVAPLAGIRRLLPPKALWQSSQLHLKTGEDIGDLEEFIKISSQWVTAGLIWCQHLGNLVCAEALSICIRLRRNILCELSCLIQKSIQCVTFHWRRSVLKG